MRAKYRIEKSGPKDCSGIPITSHLTVVDEGPEKVLADLGVGAPRNVERIGHQQRLAAHERDARGGHGHIGATAHGDADIGGRQRRRVVDAVADHGHDASIDLHRTHHPQFVVGRQIAARIGDAWYPIGSNNAHLYDTLPRLQAGIGRLREATHNHVGRTMTAKRGEGMIFVNCMEKLTMNAPRETLQQIQRALKAAGPAPGPIDGLLTVQTMRAVNAYQREKGLPVDPYLNMETVKSLGMN